MHVEVIRLNMGKYAAFGVIRGPGYRKLIVNADPLLKPLTPEEREQSIRDFVAMLQAETD